MMERARRSAKIRNDGWTAEVVEGFQLPDRAEGTFTKYVDDLIVEFGHLR